VRSLIVLYSYHHNNTEKVANAIASIIDAEIKTPDQLSSDEVQEYDLIGFGSGIYGSKHHQKILDLAVKLPNADKKSVFIFSTSSNLEAPSKNHSVLREILISKGYRILDEFTCAGFNTNSFIKYFGGLNRGRPNNKDLESASKFARSLERRV
jgi:flavodoxin